MRKLLAAGLVLLLCSTLVACGKKKAGEAQTDTKAGQEQMQQNMMQGMKMMQQGKNVKGGG